MAHLITTLGPRSADELGLILPHEHIFVDLGPIAEENWRAATAEQVIPVMAPEIEKIQAQGVTALVECTPVGVGRHRPGRVGSDGAACSRAHGHLPGAVDSVVGAGR